MLHTAARNIILQPLVHKLEMTLVHTRKANIHCVQRYQNSVQSGSGQNDSYEVLIPVKNTLFYQMLAARLYQIHGAAFVGILRSKYNQTQEVLEAIHCLFGSSHPVTLQQVS